MLPIRSITFVVLLTLVIVATGGLDLVADGQPALPLVPGMGSYGDLFKNICGKQGVSWNPNELPWIGCFGLSSNRSASGIVAGHALEVAVDANGNEVCKADGQTVSRLPGAAMSTNVSGVFYGPCNGLNLCSDQGGGRRDCSAYLNVISHNDDKSIYFYIAHKVGGNVFVTNQENWDSQHAAKQ